MQKSAPLEGLLVFDFSRVLAGPHCGRALVDLGADVIKIEPPVGDMSRFGQPRVHSLSTGYTQQNCGKRNVSLDLRRPEAVDLLRRLAARADVVLENFRPGVMQRMGLGYDELSHANPRLIFASISGYGQSGTWSHRRAYAPLIHAEMGLLDTFARCRQLDVAQEPHSHADLFAGLQCLAGILTALYQRERSGRGQHVDVAMAEAMLFASEYASTSLSGMHDRAPVHPATVASPVFRTKTPHAITVGGDPVARDNFRDWCRALGRDELLQDPHFADQAARREHERELHELLQEWVLRFDDLEKLDAALADAGLVMGVVRNLAEAGATRWAAERGAVVAVDDRAGGEVRIPNSPWRFSDATSGARGVPAYRGEHNREVLREQLGLADAELDRLEAEGVLSSRLPGRAENAE